MHWYLDDAYRGAGSESKWAGCKILKVLEKPGSELFDDCSAPASTKNSAVKDCPQLEPEDEYVAGHSDPGLATFQGKLPKTSTHSPRHTNPIPK